MGLRYKMKMKLNYILRLVHPYLVFKLHFKVGPPLFGLLVLGRSAECRVGRQYLVQVTLNLESWIWEFDVCLHFKVHTSYLAQV